MCVYLAGLVVHIKSYNSMWAPWSTLQQQQVSRQLIGQVGLSCATGARQNDASVLLQQGDVALQHWLWDQRVEHHRVHVPATHTWIHPQTHVSIFM